MKAAKAELKKILKLKEFPRSAKYDPEWVLQNQMGPNVLWLTEALTKVMDLKPGMRVLDMGCGRAISSIFLAKEFGVQVWATDLWINAVENYKRICTAKLEKRVFPIHSSAHDLPFAEGFFDVIVSLDAYHYFGTEDLFLGKFSKFVKPKGQIGIVVPGVLKEFNGKLPKHLEPYWEWEFCSFHSPEWWHKHWEKTGKVDVIHSDAIKNGWRHWLLWQDLLGEKGLCRNSDEAEMLRQDKGRNLTITRLVARRK